MLPLYKRAETVRWISKVARGTRGSQLRAPARGVIHPGQLELLLRVDDATPPNLNISDAASATAAAAAIRRMADEGADAAAQPLTRR
eukprot:9493208-Pyramimonas_sp.AAC.1